MSYKPTGYPKGRPRTGEIRPLTPRMLARRRWYYDNHERELERGREASAKFRRDHPERARELQQNYRARKAEWAKAAELMKAVKKLRRLYGLDQFRYWF